MSVVLVGVDGSESSKHAVEFAATRATQLGFSVVVAHVIPWSPYSFNTPQENERRSIAKKEEIDAATEQIIDPAVATIANAGLEVSSLVQHGDPVDLLIDVAEENEAVQIVVGRTGDSRVKRAIFGTIPSQLVQHAPVPVTVVP